MFDRFRRVRPLTWNALAVLVEKYIGVALARVQLGEILRDHDAFGINPGAVANSAASVGRFVTVIRIVLYAQVSMPGLVAGAYCARQLLANAIRALEPAEVCSFTLRAADEEAHIRIGLGALSAKALALADAEDNESSRCGDKKDSLFHKLPLSLKSYHASAALNLQPIKALRDQQL